MDTNEVNKKFEEIMKPAKAKAKPKARREPAKFPELRYLWGIALLGSFVLTVITSLISSVISG